MTISTVSGSSAVGWTIKAIGQGIPSPILVGSVTSQSAGAERIERMQANSSGVVTFQSGSWVGNGSSGGTGVWTHTISTAYSGQPQCFCAVNDASGPNTCAVDSESTTSFRVVTRNANTPTNMVYKAWCMGPR